MSRSVIILCLLAAACSDGAARPDVKPAAGWARETLQGQTSAAAYLTIVNNGNGEDRLVAVKSEMAPHAMLHSTATEEGVTRMRHMHDGLEIPSKTAVDLSPGRTHIMLTGLKAPLRRGQTFELQLQFERSGRRRAKIKVLDPTSAGLQEAR